MSRTRLRSRPRSRERSGSANPLYSWLSICVFSLLTLGVIISYWAGYHVDDELQMWENRPATIGTVSGARVVEDSFITVPRSKSQLSYVCQCLVEYSVAGKQYSIWTTSDRDANRNRLLAECSRACPMSHYTVHYDPDQPSNAQAFLSPAKAQ